MIDWIFVRLLECNVQGPKVVLGPGTGLGEAQLFWDDIQGGYRVWPSEGSHACFAPRGWKQQALQVTYFLRIFPLSEVTAQRTWQTRVMCDS